MKTLASDIKDAVFELNQKGIWVRLYEVDIDASTKRYLTDHTESITYQAQAYTPFPITHADIPETAKPEMQTFTLGVANIDRSIVTDLENGKILGNNLKITWLFLKESDKSQAVFAFDELYQILSAEIDDSQATVNFEIGQFNLFKVRLPKNRWIDSRCEFVFKDIGTCHYGREEFSGTTRGVLYRNKDRSANPVGGDGLKWQGWRLLNSAILSGVDKGGNADIDLTNAGHLTMEIDKDALGHFSTSTNNGVFFYKKFPISDFDVELHVDGDSDELSEHCGFLITTDSDSTTSWLQYMQRFSGGKRITVHTRAGGTETEDYDTASTNKFFRIEKTGNDFKFYHKATEAASWGSSVVTSTRSDLNGVQLRIGLFIESSSASRTTKMIAKFDFFRLLSGGESVCKRTFSDCLLRENSRRYGGAQGILRGPLIFLLLILCLLVSI